MNHTNSAWMAMKKEGTQGESMILFRALNDFLGSRRRAPAEPMEPPDDAAESFVRKTDVPSVLALTHSYRGNGAAEMMTFLLTWLAKDLGWQVNALASGLSETDKHALTGRGIGLIDAINPTQYDIAIANTVVSGLGHVERVGRYLPCVLWVHEGETVLWNAQPSIGSWKRVFATCAHLVFQSRWQAERIFGSFTSNLPLDRYSVIPNCLPAMPTTGLSFAKPPGKKRIVFIGGVYERKRPADLVDAVLKLGRDDVECIFIGTADHVGSLPASVQSTLKSDARFRLTDEIGRQEAIAYLASADVLSLPSGDESQPLVLLEAAHMHVPVVISDLPVYRDYWIDGENCLKHAVGDIDGLAAHLQTCLEGCAPAPVILNEADVSMDAFLDRFKQVFVGLLPMRFATASGRA